MRNFIPGHAIHLLRGGNDFFPALICALDAAQREIWLETYIFADDASGRAVADALIRAVRRGVDVRVLIDGWGARLYLSKTLERELTSVGVDLLFYRPEVENQPFRFRRLRRLHRKLCHIDGKVAFIGGINIIDDMNTPGHTPPRIDFAVRVEGPILANIVRTMHRVRTLVELSQLQNITLEEDASPAVAEAAGAVRANLIVRDNLNHRHAIERAYRVALGRARQEAIIACAYFFPGWRFQKALIAAAQRGVKVTLLLQERVEYKLMHYAVRTLYEKFLDAGVEIQEYHHSFLHAKVAVIDGQFATVGSSNIDPYSFLMAREANVIIHDPDFAGQLRSALLELITDGAKPVLAAQWQQRTMMMRLLSVLAYGTFRLIMAVTGADPENGWFPMSREAREAHEQKPEEPRAGS
ncbi:MAG: cardiolipin synthase ClsB [Proteobacteria bacterium]|nr:cardiolipin synthase ClsB [Pseudomonadota bacterium]MCL2310387.1 cardiolipin synthase ClsB [Pseudomonadota bacterium]